MDITEKVVLRVDRPNVGVIELADGVSVSINRLDGGLALVMAQSKVVRTIPLQQTSRIQGRLRNVKRPAQVERIYFVMPPRNENIYVVVRINQNGVPYRLTGLVWGIDAPFTPVEWYNPLNPVAEKGINKAIERNRRISPAY